MARKGIKKELNDVERQYALKNHSAVHQIDLQLRPQQGTRPFVADQVVHKEMIYIHLLTAPITHSLILSPYYAQRGVPKSRLF